MPAPAPLAAAPAAAPAVTKFRIILRVGEGEPSFEVRQGDDLMMKVVCEKVDIKSPEKGQTLSTRAEWTSPPGAPLAVAPFIAAFGYSPFAARLPSVLAALVVLVATCFLERVIAHKSNTLYAASHRCVQQVGGPLVHTALVQDPAQGVGDVRVIGGRFLGALSQLERLFLVPAVLRVEAGQIVCRGREACP